MDEIKEGLAVKEDLLFLSSDRREDEGALEVGNWVGSCLKNFSDFLSFQTEGFEEILNLMSIMKDRRKKTKRERNQGNTMFNRELRKMEWNI